MATEMPRRVAVAAVAIPLAAGMVYLGGWVLVVGLALLGVFGTREFFALTARGGCRRSHSRGTQGRCCFR